MSRTPNPAEIGVNIDAPTSPFAHIQLTTPSLRTIFLTWLALGAQSFGGGSATMFLIRRAMVEQLRWITEEDFTRYWAISQMTPGINLLCITILIGRQVAGAVGVFLSLLGLLLPSISITVLMTAAYTSIQQLEIVKAALRGIVPGTIGLSILMTYQIARPLMIASHKEGRTSLVVSCLIIIGSLLGLLWQMQVALVLLAGGFLGAVAQWWQVSRVVRGNTGDH
ncbi:MAG: chromate transporter [Chloroflexi bacterium]|nr:chromate transporter [Chloroflexota bacterium]